MSFFSVPSPIEQLHSSLLREKGLEVYVKRDDLIHPVVSGNKWRKLKFNIEQAKIEGHSNLLTFGGAYSNHLVATAKTGNLLGFNTIGLVRGEPPKRGLGSTLTKCEELGMELNFLSREEYRKKTEKDFIKNLRARFGKFYLIPEGGANELGIKGCEEIIPESPLQVDYVACAAGTATTASGILRTLNDEQLILVPALKGGSFLKNHIRGYVSESQMNKLIMFDDFHFGGYAKINASLIDFANQFYREYAVPLDLVYTAKLFYGIFHAIEQDYFKRSSKLLIVHSGGLQGNSGMENRHQFKLDYC